MKALSILAACALFVGSTVAANASPFVMTLEEVGSNVVATGSGAIDLAQLTFELSAVVGAGILPDAGQIGAGATATVSIYTAPLSGPSSFGSGGPLAASSVAGDFVGVNAFPQDAIFVPIGYASGSPLADTAIYGNATFATLGVTPGTYVWTWGTGADQSFTLEIGQTPLPAALPLFATGLGGLGLLGWRRKRKAQAV